MGGCCFRGFNLKFAELVFMLVDNDFKERAWALRSWTISKVTSLLSRNIAKKGSFLAIDLRRQLCHWFLQKANL